MDTAAQPHAFTGGADSPLDVGETLDDTGTAPAPDTNVETPPRRPRRRPMRDVLLPGDEPGERV